MKKQNLKSLKISKVSISNFTVDANTIKGGASGLKYSCPFCQPLRSIDPRDCSPM